MPLGYHVSPQRAQKRPSCIDTRTHGMNALARPEGPIILENSNLNRFQIVIFLRFEVYAKS